jgi:hypothetical protein
MQLTTRETSIKKLMFGLFTPVLHNYLEAHNPDEYARWHGNCCRQTAILGAMVLKSALPEYTWSAWDGWFNDLLYGKRVEYNHAWIYGIDKETGRALLVDLARMHKERLFIPTRANAYPHGHPEYKDQVEVSRERLDLDESMKGTEYYTGLPSYQVLSDVTSIMAAVHR